MIKRMIKKMIKKKMINKRMINKVIIMVVAANIKYFIHFVFCDIVCQTSLHNLVEICRITIWQWMKQFQQADMCSFHVFSSINSRMQINVVCTRYSIAFPFILSLIDIDVEHSSMTKLSFSVFVLSLISFLCFINVILYMAGYVLIQSKDYENKYPRLRRIIKFYKNSSLIFMIIDGLMCLSSLLVLLIFSLLYAYRYSLM